MTLDFINSLAKTNGIDRKDLIEKDILLHQILSDLSKDKFFSSNFLFKGGTCLVKAYLGYVRFSEDIDFTWKKQGVFKGKSQKEIRRYLSQIIDKTGSIFEKIAKNRYMDFACDKKDTKYVELGGSNKSCTFKVWYDSETLARQSFIKVQINFVENLLFKHKKSRLQSLYKKKDSRLDSLYPESKEYAKTIPFDVYDVREILAEKIRAILTREGVKARDFVDVYLVCNKFGIRLDAMEKHVIKKTEFALNLYQKYRTNLKAKTILLDSKELFDWGNEKALLISEINQKDFYSFLNDLNEMLKRITKSW